MKFLHKRVLTVILVTVDTGHSFPEKRSETVMFGAGMGQRLVSTVHVVGVSLPSHSAQPFPMYSSYKNFCQKLVVYQC